MSCSKRKEIGSHNVKVCMGFSWGFHFLKIFFKALMKSLIHQKPTERSPIHHVFSAVSLCSNYVYFTWFIQWDSDVYDKVRMQILRGFKIESNMKDLFYSIISDFFASPQIIMLSDKIVLQRETSVFICISFVVHS